MRETGDIVRAFEGAPGEPFALATLVKARGSTYRRPGARMLISRAGQSVGSLSGGCLEEEVVESARLVLWTGTAALLEFDTRRRFGCHGSLEILIEPADNGFLRELADHFHSRRPGLIATPAIVSEARSRFLSDPETAPAETFLQRFEPSPQLLLIGQGPDTRAVLAIAETLGWQGVPMHSAADLEDRYDASTVALVGTHNYGRDFAALRALSALSLPYIGLLGPRARRDQLLGDLLDTGVDPGPCFFAPAGLDLGGESPETIALSIVAEIQAVLAGGSRQSLRERKAPIHPVLTPISTAG